MNAEMSLKLNLIYFKFSFQISPLEDFKVLIVIRKEGRINNIFITMLNIGNAKWKLSAAVIKY